MIKYLELYKLNDYVYVQEEGKHPIKIHVLFYNDWKQNRTEVK